MFLLLLLVRTVDHHPVVYTSVPIVGGALDLNDVVHTVMKVLAHGILQLQFGQLGDGDSGDELEDQLGAGGALSVAGFAGSGGALSEAEAALLEAAFFEAHAALEHQFARD